MHLACETIEENELIVTSVAVSLGLILMVGVVLYFVISYYKNILNLQKEIKQAESMFQKQMTDAVLLKVEEERNRISEDLHDEIGTMLSVVKLNQQRLFRLVPETSENKEIIDVNSSHLNGIVSKIKSISDELASPTLRHFGFYAALEELCLNIHSTKQVSVKYLDQSENHKLEKSTEVQLLRICSELLNNVLKHSLPKNIVVNVQNVKQRLVISINHDGVGLSNDRVVELMKVNRGLGLKNIFSRAQMINAEIDYNNIKVESPFIQLKLVLPPVPNKHV